MIPNLLNSYYNTLCFNLAYPHLYSTYEHPLSSILVNFPQEDLQGNKTQVKLQEQESQPIVKIEEDLPLKPIEQQMQCSKKATESSEGGDKSKKQFKKDKRCPVDICVRKYSSRIALRAHIRKQHSGWYQETSEYEP